MIILFFCPDRDSLHAAHVFIHKMVVKGEPVVYFPSAREVIDARRRNNGGLVGYFQTCDSCLVKGIMPELVKVKDYHEWAEEEDD